MSTWKARETQVCGLSDGEGDAAIERERLREERRQKKGRTKWVILEYMLRSNNIAMWMVIKRAVTLQTDIRIVKQEYNTF